MFGGVPLDEEKTKKLGEAFGFLNTFLGSSEYAAGSTFTVADITLLASITSMEVGTLFCESPKSKI